MARGEGLIREHRREFRRLTAELASFPGAANVLALAPLVEEGTCELALFRSIVSETGTIGSLSYYPRSSELMYFMSPHIPKDKLKSIERPVERLNEEFTRSLQQAYPPLAWDIAEPDGTDLICSLYLSPSKAVAGAQAFSTVFKLVDATQPKYYGR